MARLKDRRFVEVTGDNFDSVLESMKPHVAFAVDNKLSEDSDAAQLKVDLHFKTLEDFEPEQVARQVKPLRELLELRSKLNDLRGNSADQREARRAAGGRGLQHGEAEQAAKRAGAARCGPGG